MENLIEKYLKEKGMTQTEFAGKVGIVKQLVSWHIQHPKSRWNPQTALKIERVTDGEITFNSLIL